jgi:hypothetical protein
MKKSDQGIWENSMGKPWKNQTNVMKVVQETDLYFQFEEK